MQKYLAVFLVLSIACYAEDSSKDVSSWLKEELRETLAQNFKKPSEEPAPIKKCATGIKEPIDAELFAFVSFSMPDEALLVLAKDIGTVGGVLVLRGLPDNSFKALAKRLLVLKEKGLTTTIQINPRLFEDYNVAMVPAFVLPGEQTFDKVSGHISLEYALEIFEDGETGKAKKLLAKLKGRAND